MNVIDFTKGIGYKVIRFPDGEVHLQLEELNRKEGVVVIMRIRNAEDLFLLMQLSDILQRQEIVVEELRIPYLMSMRCDRVFSFDRPFTLKIVADVVNKLNCRPIIYEPHSKRSLELMYAGNVEVSRDLAFVYKQTSTICFPDKGAQSRYNLFNETANIVCEKVRDVNTGELKEFKVVNPKEFKGGDITVIDDLCDGGGTFIGLAPKLRDLHPTKLRLVVTHAVQLNGIKRVAEVYDEVVITNTYEDWENFELPNNVIVKDVLYGINGYAKAGRVPEKQPLTSKEELLASL